MRNDGKGCEKSQSSLSVPIYVLEVVCMSRLCNRLLVLAPHTDDAELGCGGLIVRLAEEGAQVHIVAFSSSAEILPVDTPSNTLRKEFELSAKVLCVPHENVSVMPFPIRRLGQFRQEILDVMIGLRRELVPDMVLVPTRSDIHQDHVVVTAEAVRAFKDISIWGYELPWNHIAFEASAFVILSHEQMDAKWRALESYRSQIELRRHYFTRESIEAIARFRGLQVKTEFAEAFEVIRMRY